MHWSLLQILSLSDESIITKALSSKKEPHFYGAKVQKTTLSSSPIKKEEKTEFNWQINETIEFLRQWRTDTKVTKEHLMYIAVLESRKEKRGGFISALQSSYSRKR